MGLVHRDLIEDYYRRFIEIWQTSASLDEAHHRTIETLDPTLTDKKTMTSRMLYLKCRGVVLKELEPYCIDWLDMARFADSFKEVEQNV